MKRLGSADQISWCACLPRWSVWRGGADDLRCGVGTGRHVLGKAAYLWQPLPRRTTAAPVLRNARLAHVQRSGSSTFRTFSRYGAPKLGSRRPPLRLLLVIAKDPSASMAGCFGGCCHRLFSRLTPRKHTVKPRPPKERSRASHLVLLRSSGTDGELLLWGRAQGRPRAAASAERGSLEPPTGKRS